MILTLHSWKLLKVHSVFATIMNLCNPTNIMQVILSFLVRTSSNVIIDGRFTSLSALILFVGFALITIYIFIYLPVDRCDSRAPAQKLFVAL